MPPQANSGWGDSVITVTRYTVATTTTEVTFDPTTTITLVDETTPSLATNGMRWYRYDSEYDYEEGERLLDLSRFQNNDDYTLSGVYDAWGSYGWSAGKRCNILFTPDPSGCNPMVLVLQGFWYARDAGTYTFKAGP